MNLRKALSVLSKASPYAVSTSRSIIDPFFDEIKDYLYIPTDIEKAFVRELENISDEKIIFLCGSSGDGKSEILTRYSNAYADKVIFHLDATHSFKSKLTAIETLDNVFTRNAGDNKPLVVGINIGMLGNYEREGSSEHSGIKESIKRFLNNEQIADDRHIFLDFESFNKFKIENGQISSEFFKTLLEKVTSVDEGNHFQQIYKESLVSGKEKRLVANFSLLSDESVQKEIILLLMRSRISKDQFITARMLLDFVYCILTRDGYIFDNIFLGGGNELLTTLADFDPSAIKNRVLDEFVLLRKLELIDDEYVVFKNELKDKFNVYLSDNEKPQTLVRLLYLLRNSHMENDFLHRFIPALSDSLLDTYKDIWELHKEYSGDADEKKKLKEFYQKIVFSAINRYTNRNAPQLSKDEFFISSHGGCDLASEVDLSVVYKDIENDAGVDLTCFNMYFLVNNEALDALPVSINLLDLMIKIVHGYRPNKYDKNSIVLLDELIDKIKDTANKSKKLHIYSDDKLIKVKINLDDEIRVSGL